MPFLNRSVSPAQRSNSPMASNCETELQENHPAEAKDKLFLTKKETEATIDGQEQLNNVSNQNTSNGNSLLQTADENSDASQGQRLYRVALLAMCFVSAVSLGLTLLMLFGVLHVASPQCTCSGETEISELKKNLQDLKRNLSALREPSMKRELEMVKKKGENTSELWFILNGTVHEKFLDFQKQLVKLDQKVKNVRKIPGPIGPPGYNGSEGPVGRKGSGDFSQCQYATKSEAMLPGTTRVLVSINEPTNKRIMAATCSTDYSAEYNLISTVQGGTRRYVCVCAGQSLFFNGGTSCYAHYWICPLTT